MFLPAFLTPKWVALAQALDLTTILGPEGLPGAGGGGGLLLWVSRTKISGIKKLCYGCCTRSSSEDVYAESSIGCHLPYPLVWDSSGFLGVPISGLGME